MSKPIVCIAVLILAGMACGTKKENVRNVSTSDTENKVEESLIRETIEGYFEGWMTGDTTLIGRAMHKTCQLKNIKEDEVVIYERATYLGFFKPRPRRENAGGRIVSINITDDIAAAKCEIFTKDRLYTDYFNLMKLKDRWYIVDKIATNKPKQ